MRALVILSSALLVLFASAMPNSQSADESVRIVHTVNELYTNTLFLLRKKSYEEAVPVADELYTEACKPEQDRWRNRYSWGLIARYFADANEQESNKFYKAAYDWMTHEPNLPMNSGYPSMALEWASMLEKHGKLNEAIEVLKQAISFTETFNPRKGYKEEFEVRLRTFDENASRLTDKCEQYLRTANRTKEALIVRNKFTETKKELEIAQVSAWDRTIADPSTNALERIEALADKGYAALQIGNCDEGTNLLTQALKVYESSAPYNNRSDPYLKFFDIERRFVACGHKEEGTQFLWRLLKAHMKTGFGYQDRFEGCYIQRPPETADQELLSFSLSSAIREQNYKQILSLAKESGNPNSVIFFLQQSPEMYSNRKSSLYKEIEEWTAKTNDPNKYRMSVLHTAYQYLNEDKFDEAEKSWKLVLEQEANSTALAPDNRREISGYLIELGREYFRKNRPLDAGTLYLLAFKRSYGSFPNHMRDNLVKEIGETAKKDLETGHAIEGKDLLKDALHLAESPSIDGIDAVRALHLDLANFPKVNSKKY